MSASQRKRANLAASERDNVAMLYCRPENVDGAHHDCALLLAFYDGRNNQRLRYIFPCETGPRISAARNQLVQQALLDPATEWLFLVDADMTFGEDVLDRMVVRAREQNVKVLGGLCFAGGRSGVVLPTLYTVDVDDSGHMVSELHLQIPDVEMIRVHATGAACLLVHREVFEAVQRNAQGRRFHPWFQETTVDPDPATGYGGAEFGEDVTFCLRAGQAGYEIWIDSTIEFGHRKKTVLDRQAHAAYVQRLAAGETPNDVRRAELARMGLRA